MADNLTSQPAEQPKETPRPSPGDKKFDWLVYGALNGIGTFLLTIPLAYQAEHGIGKKWFDRALTSLRENNMSAGNARNLLMTNTLFLGGLVMVAPVRLAESYRTQIVSWLNRNETPEVRADAEKNQPPMQTWASLLKGRVLAWATVFTSFKLISLAGYGPALGKFEENFAEKVVCGPLKKATHTLPMEEVQALKALGTHDALKRLHLAETKPFILGKLAALDVFATAAATALLYTASRFFAKHRSPEREEKLEERALAHQTHHKGAVVAGAPEPAAREQDAGVPGTTVGGDKLRPGMVAQVQPAQVMSA